VRKPHVVSVIDSLSEPWFIGTEMGSKYGRLLLDALTRRHDGDFIENALSLGDYKLHTGAVKRQRVALRAVLLASFVVKRQPLSLRDTLLAKYNDRDLPFLIREFRFLFPAIADDNRHTWEPSNFTDPATLNAYTRRRAWTSGGAPRYRFIVHGVRYQSEVLDDPIAKLSQWLCISMCLLSDTKPMSFSNHGVILGVPATNIITTSPTDQWFDNYAGTDRSIRAPGVSMSEHIIDKNLRIGGLLTPTQIINRQGTNAAMESGDEMTLYNEIVACGIPNMAMPFGGRTGRLRLLGTFIQTRMDGTLPNFYFDSQGDAKLVEAAAMACARRYHVPLLYLPTTAIR
jgi:hypothetical protein